MSLSTASEIDWSKAPSDATHASIVHGSPVWYKQINGEWFWFSREITTWFPSTLRRVDQDMIPRHQQNTEYVCFHEGTWVDCEIVGDLAGESIYIIKGTRKVFLEGELLTMTTKEWKRQSLFKLLETQAKESSSTLEFFDYLWNYGYIKQP